MRYWVRINKESLGPFTPTQIRQHPEITEDTLVYPEAAKNGATWKRLREVPELLGAARQEPSASARSPQPGLRSSTAADAGQSRSADIPATPASQGQVASPTHVDRGRLAVFALGLTAFCIPWSFIVYESPRLWRLLTGVPLWYVPVLLILLPIIGSLTLAAISWSRAVKTGSRSGNAVATAALVIGAVHLVAASLFSVLLYRVSHKAAATVSQSIQQKDVQPAVSAADPWANREQEAISLMKSFHVHKALFPRCPRSLDTVADGVSGPVGQVETWPQVQTIPDVIACKRFLPVVLLVRMVAGREKQEGRFPGEAEFASQAREGADQFKQYEINVVEEWSAKKSADSSYIVEVSIHEAGHAPAGPVDHRYKWKWQISLSEKEIKPLNFGAWATVDSSAAGKWADAEARRNPSGQVATKSDTDMIDVSEVAPTYRLNESPSQPEAGK